MIVEYYGIFEFARGCGVFQVLAEKWAHAVTYAGGLSRAIQIIRNRARSAGERSVP